MDPNKQLGQGCLAILARTVIVRLISVFAVLGIAAFSCVIGSMVGSATGGTWGLITGTILFAVFVFGGGFAFAIVTVYRRKIYLDRAFVPIGLKGSVYRLVFRKYTGEIRGRQVEVYFYRGPTVEIFFQSRLKTRLGASPAYGDTMFFSRLVDSKPLEHRVGKLQKLKFWAEEPAWATGFISHQPVQDSLLRTLTTQTFFVRSFVKLFPDVLQIHHSGNTNVFSWEIPPSQVELWFSDAFTLLDTAETKVPAPQNPIEMSSAERLALTVKRKDTTKISIILAAAMIVFFGFVFIAAILFIYLIK